MSVPPIRPVPSPRRRRRGFVFSTVSLWRHGTTNPDEAWPNAYWKLLRTGFLGLFVWMGVFAGVFYLVIFKTTLVHRFGPWPLIIPSSILGMILANPLLRASALRTRVMLTGFSVCPECGHSLTELSEVGTCPKCGYQYTSPQVVRIWQRALRRGR